MISIRSSLRSSLITVILVGMFHLVSQSAQASSSGLSPQKRLRADRLISVFENQSLDFQYDYIDNLHDGRGFTAGRAGFCTACGDLYEVVKSFTAVKPVNPLAKYLQKLKKLAETSDIKTSSLRGFLSAWKSASLDPKFRQAQDEYVDIHLFRPAVQTALSFGIDSDLGIAAIYEAAVQHDFGDDDDSVVSMLKEAGGNNPHQVDLEKFLQVRKAHLMDPENKDTTAAWRESVGRADEMIRLYRTGNLQFEGPIEVAPFGRSFVIP